LGSSLRPTPRSTHASTPSPSRSVSFTPVAGTRRRASIPSTCRGAAWRRRRWA
jgi:hypothetical protein